MLVVVVGWVTIAWALLIVVSAFAGSTSGSGLGQVAAALIFVAYGATLIKRDRRAMTFTWVIVALFGLAVVLGGLVPLQIAVWVALLAFAFYLRRHPTVLRSS